MPNQHSHLGHAAYRGSPPRVSVVILAHNEEGNIAECLRSCAWSDDVHVLDSGSTDRTVEIARELGATVHHNPFTSFGQQRNWAIDNIRCRHPWQFHLDADERFTQELVREMCDLLGPEGLSSDRVAYRVPNKMIFLGKWLRRSGGYPAYQVRLIRTGKCRFMDFGHGQREQCDGPIGTLEHPYIHYSFSKGLVEWFRKHNAYSDREAHEAITLLRDAGGRAKSWRELLSRDPLQRRRAAKNLSYSLRFRALFRFGYNYFIRGGLLDGIAGLRYCAMISMYEYWTELKITEHFSHWERKTTQTSQRMSERESSPSHQAIDRAAAPSIDVMIPTLNEADHIEETVRNASEVGPVFVLDSLSRDGTQERARQSGATVVEHAFTGYARQKNWGLANLPMQNDWVFILDADERLTPELMDELRQVVSRNGPVNGYLVNRVMIFMGRPIWFGGLYPSWNLRFFRRNSCWYEDRQVHEHMVCQGPAGYLKHRMLHIRRESMARYIDKHIQYADLESDEWVKRKLGHGGGARASSLFNNLLRLRQWVRREVWPTLPLRPMWRALWMYVVRLGFLDGAAGWNLAMLMASYEFMISLLYQDKLNRAAGLPRRTRSDPPRPAAGEKAGSDAVASIKPAVSEGAVRVSPIISPTESDPIGSQSK